MRAGGVPWAMAVAGLIEATSLSTVRLFMTKGYHAGGWKGKSGWSIPHQPNRFSTSSGNRGLIVPRLRKPLFAQHNKA